MSKRPLGHLVTPLAPLAWTAVALGLALARPSGVLSIFGLLRGPLGVALGTLALAITLRRLRKCGRALSPPRPPILFAVATVLLLGVGVHYVDNLRVSGDEPHYLLMAQSLWREGDLDLRDNLARQDYLEYTPGPLVPHYGAPRRDGRPFPAHSPGLPALLAPVYGLGRRRACVAVLALAAALLAEQCRFLAWRLTADARAALAAWAVALGPPVFFYSFHIYTEVPAALALAGGLRLLLGAPGAGGAVMAALLASTLPWLHVKMIPAALALGVVAIARLRGRPRVGFLATAGAGAGALLGYYFVIFGRATPLALYGGVPTDAFASPVSALGGLLLDRSFGLLPHAPVFLVALAGLPALMQPLRQRWPYLLVAAAVVGPVLFWRMWWGGQCPPGRFLVPLVPVLSLAIAGRAAAGGAGLARWSWPLWSAGLALAVFMSFEPGRLLLLNRGDRPTRVWATLEGDVSPARYLPSLVFPEAAEARVALVWIALLTALLVLDRLALRRTRMASLFAGGAFPFGVFLLLGALVDGWARR